MARLFITPREMNFISDITKEIIRDVAAQKIFFYSISLTKSNTNELYEESISKVWDNPVILNVLVDYKPNEVVTNVFGVESQRSIEVYIQSRDLYDIGVEIDEGDFFTYGPNLFEIIQVLDERNIYGQTEHTDGIRLVGKQARKGQFFTKVFGPTDHGYSDADAVQTSFYQHRGAQNNAEGQTGDIRSLQANNVLDPPLSGPQSVLPTSGSDNRHSSFYDGG